jgi:hypothetical protein
MLSHIQPTALVGLVAGQAGHALAFGGILAVFVVFVHAKPLSPSLSCFIRSLTQLLVSCSLLKRTRLLSDVLDVNAFNMDLIVAG